MADDQLLLHATPLAGLIVVERRPLGDERGYLERLYDADVLARIGIAAPPVQVNRTLTRRAGTIRGLHFQHPPHAEDKLVSVLHGEVFDVAIDLRAGSPTFLHWHGERLSADNRRALAIPKGFAHGFQTLSNDCELLYLHTARYRSDAEDGISALDTRLGITWPRPPGDMSDRDRRHPPLAADFTGLSLP